MKTLKLQFLQFFIKISEIILLISLISLAFLVIIRIGLCYGLEEYNYLDFRFLFFVEGMILGDRCNFFCFFRPICEFNFIFIYNFIGENATVYFLFLKFCFTCALLYKNYIFFYFPYLIGKMTNILEFRLLILFTASNY